MEFSLQNTLNQNLNILKKTRTVFVGSLPVSKYTDAVLVYFLTPKMDFIYSKWIFFYIICIVASPYFTNIVQNTCNICVESDINVSTLKHIFLTFDFNPNMAFLAWHANSFCVQWHLPLKFNNTPIKVNKFIHNF